VIGKLSFNPEQHFTCTLLRIAHGCSPKWIPKPEQAKLRFVTCKSNLIGILVKFKICDRKIKFQS